MPSQDVTTGRSSPRMLEVLIAVLSPAYCASPGSSSRETPQRSLRAAKFHRDSRALGYARIRTRTADTRKPSTRRGRISVHRAPLEVPPFARAAEPSDLVFPPYRCLG